MSSTFQGRLWSYRSVQQT